MTDIKRISLNFKIIEEIIQESGPYMKSCVFKFLIQTSHGCITSSILIKMEFPRRPSHLIYDTINRGESINMKWRKFTRWLYSFNFYASTLYHYNSIQLFILLKLVKLLHLRIYVLDSLQIWNIIACELYSEYGTSESCHLGLGQRIRRLCLCLLKFTICKIWFL